VGTSSLDQILITPLKSIETPGGAVLHAIKNSDVGYVGFGEAYFSWVVGGAVKAWKRHTRMTMNIVVPIGQVRFVFCAISTTSGNKEFRVEEIGVDRYVRITVPPDIWFGFQGLGQQQNLVLNIANISHDPNEVERLKHNDIVYNWSGL
jgi:dTDP-4-dehydrorhamnose 3,5-epimerase